MALQVRGLDARRPPWGWPPQARRTWSQERSIPYSATEGPRMQAAPRTTTPSLALLSDSALGDRPVELHALWPPRGAAPPAARPFGRCRARLWEVARYVKGWPPAQHGALCQMARCWQAVWRSVAQRLSRSEHQERPINHY